VITAGRLGDMFGRRLIFIVGMLIFTAGSVVSALAPNDEVLVVGRLVQGIGAAPMIVLSLALVCDAFSTSDQARALGIWAGVSALALGIGPLVGGVLIGIDWRLIFWINLPIAAVGLAIVLIATRESSDPSSGTKVDVPGLLALTLGLGAVVLALVEADDWGWGDLRTLVLLLGGAAALVAFWFVEHRVREPLVDFHLFRNGPFFGATAAAFTLVGSYWCVMFFQPQYLEEVQGHSAISAGVLILPVTVPMIFISPFAGRLIKRFGARRLMTTGMLLALAGLLVMTQVESGTSYGVLFVGLLLFGIALGFVYAPMSTAAMAAMPRDKTGIASGVLAMTRVMAGAVALAATGAVFYVLEADRTSELEAKGESHSSALGDAFAYALAHATWILVGVTAVGVILTWAFVRDPETAGPDPTVAGSPPPEELQHHHHHRRFHL
jgi:EmrB/QacA subfamily drug resistance transporter